MQVQADPNQLMRQAEAHFSGGRFASARPLVERVLVIVPGHPAVLHLHGLILSRLGELEPARRALVAAQRGLPHDPQVANNLGNLLSRLGDHAAALAAYDAAIAAAPSFAPARLHRAVTLDELGRYDEARAALAGLRPPTADTLVAAASIERNAGDRRAAAALLDRALALDPGHAVARRARARIAVEVGAPDAAARHRDALAAAPEDRELLLGALAAADTPAMRRAALDRVAAALAIDPTWREGQFGWASATWEDGAHDRFTSGYERALALHPRDGGLWRDYVAVVGKVDDFAAAAMLCLRAEAATGDAAFAAGAFGYLGAAGALDEAEALGARLPAGALTPLALAKHRLRARDIAAAEPLLAAATAAAPDDVEAWALRGVAWQLLGDARFEWLNGQDGLVRGDALPLSPEEIAQIAARLREVHAGSLLRAGQSVRGGTQTADNLFDRWEPEIVMLRDTIHAAIERYRRALPPADPTHPVLRHRDAALAITASWSIRLTGGGFHVQHMHPKGVLSAASYWAVPAPPADDRHAGWLELGGAPAYLALDVPPLRRIEPRPGRLVLFPSTLHHGTRPFPAGERMSVAFDVAAA